MRYKLFIPLIVFALVTTAYGGWRVFSNPRPIMHYPSLVDLGERELGEEVTSEFEIRNEGDATLSISNIRSSCSCSGLEYLIDGEYLKVDKFKVAPGQGVRCRARLSIRSILINQSVDTAILFDTNDPDKLEGRIVLHVARVWGGTLHSPEVVTFGRLAVGERFVTHVDLWDRAIPARSIAKLVCSDPAIEAKLLPPDSSVFGPLWQDGYRHIGIIQLSISSQQPRKVVSEIQIYTSDSRPLPDVVKIQGDIVQNYRISHTQLSLPRNSSTGPVFRQSININKIDNGTFRIISIKHPPFINLEHSGNKLATSQTVEIGIDMNFAKYAGKHEISFQMQAGDTIQTQSIILDIGN